MNLEVTDLTVEYPMSRTGDSLRALDGLTFQIPQRAFVSIVGPSGCGKTTLLKVIAGLTAPSSGQVSMDGGPLGPPGRDRAMVFQTPALLPWRPVLTNVTYGLELQGVDSALAEAKAREYLDVVGLVGFEESYPSELSEGMRQRVNLARALATEPRLLLLDEPFASLDAQTRLFMQLELQEMWARTESTALFVTHQITEALLLGDVVIVLTGRPGRAKEILSVPLERPRRREMKRWPELIQLEEQIWDLIAEEVTSRRDGASAAGNPEDPPIRSQFGGAGC